MRALILHQRSALADARTEYLVCEKRKKRGAKSSTNYLANDKPNQAPGVVRVKKYWTHGFQSSADPTLDSALLMAGSNTEGRSEVVDWIISIDPEGDRQREDAMAIALTNALMAKFFPRNKFIAALHGDGAASHCHAVLCNENPITKKSIQISRKDLFRMKKYLSKWCGLEVESGWGKKRKVEREFLKLTREEIKKEIVAGNVTRYVPDKVKDNGELGWVKWRRNGVGVGKIIRWWVCQAEAKSLDWDLAKLLIEVSKFHARCDHAAAVFTGLAKTIARASDYSRVQADQPIPGKLGQCR